MRETDLQLLPRLSPTIAIEFNNYLQWVLALERAVAPPWQTRSRWYPGKFFSIYTRARSAGRTGVKSAICFASIQVQPNYAGKGVLTALLKFFEVNHEHLQAEELVFEQVLNPRLIAWLQRGGYLFTSSLEESLVKALACASSTSV